MPSTKAEGDDPEPTQKSERIKHTMDYETFKEKFVEDLKDKLYEQGAEVNVSVHNVNKLNESYEAVTVTPEGSNIGVNIPIDKFYDAIESGKTYDEVVDKDLEAIVKEVNATQVAPADKLTDSVYHYDSQAKIFELPSQDQDLIVSSLCQLF